MASRTRIIEVVSAGPQGPVGKSAYEIAVEEGFVGTQTDWLEKLSKPYAGMLGTKLASEVVEVQIDYSDILEDGEQCLNVDQIQSTPVWSGVSSVSLVGNTVRFILSGGEISRSYALKVDVNTNMGTRSGTVHIAITGA